MIDLAIRETFTIKDRGRAFVGRFDENPGLSPEKIKDLMKNQDSVQLNGEQYIIAGYETPFLNGAFSILLRHKT